MSNPPNFEPLPRIPPLFLINSANTSSISPCLNAFPSKNEYDGMFPAPNAAADGIRHSTTRAAKATVPSDHPSRGLILT